MPLPLIELFRSCRVAGIAIALSLGSVVAQQHAVLLSKHYVVMASRERATCIIN